LRRLLGVELLGELGLELLMRGIVAGVPELVGVRDHVVGVVALELARDLVAADLAAGDPLDLVEEAERLGLLDPRHEVRPPQARQHAVAAGGHDLRDERVEVGGAELGLQRQHDLGVRGVLRQRLQDADLEVVAVGIVELEMADLGQLVLAGQHRHGVAFLIGVGGGAEDVLVQLVRRHLDGLGDGRDVDDLLLLAHLRHGKPDRRGQPAEHDVDLVLGDQLLHRRRGGRRVQLVVALDRFDLAAHDAALGVQLLDGELVSCPAPARP
jgi:hypothetical protein